MSVDPSSADLRIADLERRLNAVEDLLSEIRDLARKTIWGPDPAPSIQAMKEVLRLTERE